MFWWDAFLRLCLYLTRDTGTEDRIPPFPRWLLIHLQKHVISFHIYCIAFSFLGRSGSFFALGFTRHRTFLAFSSSHWRTFLSSAFRTIGLSFPSAFCAEGVFFCEPNSPKTILTETISTTISSTKTTLNFDEDHFRWRQLRRREFRRRPLWNSDEDHFVADNFDEDHFVGENFWRRQFSRKQFWRRQLCRKDSDEDHSRKIFRRR